MHCNQATAHGICKGVFGGMLYAPVEREPQIFTGNGRIRFFGKTAHFASLCIHFDVFDALMASHSIFKNALNTAFSNVVVVAISPRFQVGILRCVDKSDIAQSMGC